MECKHCKSDKGYYEKIKLERPIALYYHSDGRDMDEEDSGYNEADNMIFISASKFIYCATCYKKIGELKNAPHINCGGDGEL
ncbi:hypothetical protein AAU07_03115 [Listeria monocytogenes]|nr:hypothetical protein [Listeria monocytogenes]EAF2116407.1 hypothetical protein [Listeria monocytogenes]